MQSAKLKRFLSVFLVFVLGFLTCVGTIVGAGYFAASKVSIDFLNKHFNANIDTGKYISSNAEVSLSAMTLLGLIEEIDILKKVEDELTVDRLLKRYGLKLTDSAENKLPDGLLSVDIRKLFTREGIDHVLKNTKVDYIFDLVPSIALSEPAKDALSDKSFMDVSEQGLTYLLDDVHLGYITGVTYELDEKNEYKVVFQDPAAPTMMELVAPLGLGKLVDSLSSNGDFLKVVAEDIGDVMAETLFESFMNLESLGFPGLFGGAQLQDIIKKDEATDRYVFNMSAAFEGKLFGNILGYTPVYLDDGVSSISNDSEKIVIGWLDLDGKPITGLMRGVASGSLDSLAKGEGLDINALISNAYFGDVMGYTPAFNSEGVVVSWKTADGGAPDALLDKAVNKKLSDMNDDDFTISSLFEDKYVGDAMGYTPVAFDSANIPTAWEDADGNEVTGMDSIIANIDISKMMGDDEYEISSVFDGKLGADLLGYTPAAYGTDKDGNTVVTEWNDADGNPVTGADKGVANLDIGKLIDPDVDYDVSDAFTTLYFGELLGYTHKGEELPLKPDETDTKYQWYNGTEPVGELDNKIANYLVGKVMNGEQTLDSDTIMDDLKIKDAFNYTSAPAQLVLPDDWVGDAPTVTIWRDKDGLKLNGIMSSLADTYIIDVTTTVDYMLIYKVLGYIQHGDDYYKLTPIPDTTQYKLEKASGLILNLADLKVSELGNSSTVDAKIKDIQLAEILGYTAETDAHGNKTGGWLSNGTKVTGIMAAIADTKVGGLEAKASTLTLGEIMNLTDNGDGTWSKEDGTPASTIMTAFVELTVNDMNNDAEIHKALDKIVLGDALNYVKNSDGVWEHKDETPVSGILKVIANKTVAEMDGSIPDIKFGDIFGYTSRTEGEATVWYDGDPNAGAPVAGGLKGAFADITIGEMSDSNELSSVIQDVTVGDALGYKPSSTHANGWQTSSGGAVDNVLAAIAGSKISELDTAIDGLMVKDLFDDSAFDSGFLSLIPKETTLDSLSKGEDEEGSLTNIFKNKTINDFIKAGLLTFGEDAVNKLNIIDIEKGNLSGRTIVIESVSKVTYIDNDGSNSYTEGDAVYQDGWRWQKLNDFISNLIS